MIILFCNDPLNEKRVDVDYEKEYLTAKKIGFSVALISLEELLSGSVDKATKRVEIKSTLETAIYRGWMMKPSFYRMLYNGLLEKNVKLINSPEDYESCHYFPNSYEIISEHTPRSLCLEINDVCEGTIYNILNEFGSKAIIIKDYVKSRKHEWEEACYIPDSSNKTHAERVIQNFISRQGEDLCGGLVFREFIPLKKITNHPISGMPLAEEYRLFFLNNKLLINFEYWDEAIYDREDQPNLDIFIDLAERINSAFFTMDIAKTEQGSWCVIEVGDGQVSGLPDKTNMEEFYKAIKDVEG
ncbi:ATP-grasp domain-containing protein [Paenibacillus sp. 19GGS1-52]|uniref:ATP-grasp domain-containing protein n=1 Tax=Paenibacillus sp. 19GGS1-52 TaxID=2758563 RepID=UPI001EFADCF1|nr:ATP-grasp domain-containing protein [Paenibacillus sp. 19GGS1-52]ULO08507.1 ATP-grasp domain-containing protein [Paenibacillus sp. 19GGS1-52]